MSGRVHLVGAGPGEPGLLTARAHELIAAADVILYDRLVEASALEGARADAELVFVGKEGGGAAVPQEQTEALMIERARAGKTVVRLKGGDPFVFGRGGEEALALRAGGIDYEVVPGVTAGVAAPAYAGIPVTHRGLASAVALVTGHTRGDGRQGEGRDCSGAEEPELDWTALAGFPGTLVFYMGVRSLAQIASSLIAAGRDAGEPAAVVQAGTLPTQRTVTGTLETIAETARLEGIGSPSITVVGAVAALAGELSWLPVQPLDPSPYDLVCLTRPNGVGALFERLAAGGRDARALAGVRVAAIGPGTAAALAERGVVADVVPQRFVAEGLVQALAKVPVRRALIARASEARDMLPEALRARGAEVDVLALYDTVVEPLSTPVLAQARSADYITFTSSSTVRFFMDAAGAADAEDRSGVGRDGRLADQAGELSADRGARLSPHTRIVSIGPVTSEALHAYGLSPDVEASRHDIEGLLDALIEDATAPER